MVDAASNVRIPRNATRTGCLFETAVRSAHRESRLTFRRDQFAKGDIRTILPEFRHALWNKIIARISTWNGSRVMILQTIPPRLILVQCRVLTYQFWYVSRYVIFQSHIIGLLWWRRGILCKQVFSLWLWS